MSRYAVLLAAALLATACTSPTTSKDELVFWHPLKDPNELKAIQGIVDRFKAAHPGINVKTVSAQDADKVTQAIRGGNPPDVALSFNANSVGAWCATGAFQDLNPLVKRDKVDLEQIPAAVRAYTEFRGKRCVMPLLADTFALYYNKKLVKEPPKTMEKLAELTKQVTQRKPDGTIEVAGFLPYLGAYQSVAEHFTPSFGAKWLKDDGTSNLATDPAFTKMLTWQKGLVDWFGADKLTTFKAGLGDEFSAQHAFETGKLAMMVDGEWRTSFIKNDGSGVDYGTAPMPADRPDLYGAGAIGGNIIGIPRGAAHSDLAWEFVKFASTDTGALVAFADAIHNVPTTLAALKSPELQLAKDPLFKPFLDVFGHPASSSLPASADGGAYLTNFGAFAEKWQQGRVPDLAAGLKELDAQNDTALKLGGS